MRISDWSSDVCSSDLRFDTIAADHHVRLEAAAVLVADSGTCFILLERPDLGACVEPNARVRPDRFENRKMNVCTMDHRVRIAEALAIGRDNIDRRNLMRESGRVSGWERGVREV